MTCFLVLRHVLEHFIESKPLISEECMLVHKVSNFYINILTMLIRNRTLLQVSLKCMIRFFFFKKKNLEWTLFISGLWHPYYLHVLPKVWRRGKKFSLALFVHDLSERRGGFFEWCFCYPKAKPSTKKSEQILNEDLKCIRWKVHFIRDSVPKKNVFPYRTTGSSIVPL